ncbi:Holliday junction resolvase RuvX [uncultured Friedmanniella sp.]|uniref:Holliday junction resolvase RuvX n=1 Tax=uncultured Friedmanniella sp. TaxID=335381 RepID=UPI0035CB48F4
MAEFRRGRRLGLDWGDARIGVAECDPDGLVAYPRDTVAAGPAELVQLAAIVAAVEPLEVVVGLPRSLNGSEGPAAVKVRERAAALAAALIAGGVAVPVRLVDERLSTVSASRRLREGGRKARAQRGVIDMAAAAEILEHALAVERASGVAAGELVSSTVPVDEAVRTSADLEGDPPRDIDARPGGQAEPGA